MLKTFREQGNYIVVATARTTIPDSIRNIEFDGYICSDGHFIIFKDKVLKNATFTTKQIETQLAIYDENNSSWVSSHTNPYLKRHHLLYEGTEDLTKTPLIEEHLDVAQVNSIAAVFGSASDLLAAKDKLPSDWTINAYGDDIDIRMDVI